MGDLEAWIDQVAAELERLQAAVDAVPAGETHGRDSDPQVAPDLEAAVGRAYLAVGRSGAEIERRARDEAAGILLAARTEAAVLVEETRRDLESVIDEARAALQTLFSAVRSG